MNFSFVQISDHHIRDSETNLIRGLSTAHNLRAVLRHIAATVGDKIDFIISSGDITDDPSAGAYQTFCNVTGLRTASPAPGPQTVNAEGLREMPVYFLPGNHDDRELFYQYLSSESKPLERMDVSFEHKGVQFVCFDQGREAKAVLQVESLEYLKQRLGEGKPTVLLTHHHLIPVGSKMLDEFLADNVADLWPLVNGQNVLGVLFGHVHNSYNDLVRGVPVMGVRSTAFQFALMPTPLMTLLNPHYRFVTVQDGVLTSRLFEVPL